MQVLTSDNVTDTRKQVGVRLPKELVLKLSHIALDREVTLNELVKAALIDWYERQPEKARYGAFSEALPKGKK